MGLKSYRNTTNSTSGHRTSSTEDGPWATIFLGVVLIGVTIFFSVTHSEQNGDAIRMPLILMPIYGMLGTPGVAAIAGIAGICFTFAGFREMVLRGQTRKN